MNISIVLIKIGSYITNLSSFVEGKHTAWKNHENHAKNRGTKYCTKGIICKRG